jgi:hypothetical protein
MPVPDRRPVDAVQPPPVLGAISTNGQKSSVPVTGRGLGANSLATPIAAQAMAGQIAAAPAPVPAPQAQAAVAQAAAEPAATPPAAPLGQDWFYAAMAQGLSKYQQTSRLAETATPQM